MGLLDVLKRKAPGEETEVRHGDFFDTFTFNGHSYLVPTTLAPQPDQAVGSDFESLVHGVYRANGVVAAAVFVRLLVFSEARFVWRRTGTDETTTTRGLVPLRRSGRLLAQMITDVDLAGNAFVVRSGSGFRRLRPDWVTVVLGAETESALVQGDAEVLAYRYDPGGINGDGSVFFLPSEVAHFAPLPDPLVQWRGISWVVSALSEVRADNQATLFKERFFKNAATPNLSVTLDIEDAQKFQEWVDKINKQHRGAANAYKTLFLGAGAKATPIGHTFSEMAFRDTIGVSESRIAMVSGVPATILGTGEGLQGSSLNAGNYGMARRRFADMTMRPLWRSACEALETLVKPPSGFHLWYDDADILFLQEDQLDESKIRQADASTIRQLTDGGYDPATVIDAITSNDMGRLVHTGLLPVQVQPPGTTADPPQEEPSDEETTDDED